MWSFMSLPSRVIDAVEHTYPSHGTPIQGVQPHKVRKLRSRPQTDTIQAILVLGLALEAAKSLGNAYEQNAVIWCGPDAVPSLVLLR